MKRISTAALLLSLGVFAQAHGGVALPSAEHGEAYNALIGLSTTLQFLQEHLRSASDAEKKLAAQSLGTANKALVAAYDAYGVYKSMREMQVLLSYMVQDIQSEKSSLAQMRMAARSLEAANGSLIGLLGPEARKRLDEQKKEHETQDRENSVKQSLGAVRSALSIYFGDKAGTYPSDLAALAEKGMYLSRIPGIRTAEHADTAAVLVLQGVANTGAVEGRATDAGGWLYVGDSASPMYGSVYINCTHTDSRGNTWFSY